MRAKTVSVGGKTVGYTYYGKWQWTAFARSRYLKEEIEQGAEQVDSTQ